MMRLRKNLNLAKQAGQKDVTVPVDELERLLEINKTLDLKIAACMEKLSPEAYQELFGELFNEPESSKPT